MIWQLIHTLGSSERYDVAFDIFRRKRNIPVTAPRMIITGRRHRCGGWKIRKKRPVLLIEEAIHYKVNDISLRSAWSKSRVST
jgi:hypothetical protein